MKTKKVKPYGKLVTHSKEYFMLAPYTEKDIWSDGTFRFLVVPFFEYQLERKVFVPRFVWTTDFLIEYVPYSEEIEIKINEEE